MKTGYKHISEGERKIIEELTQAGSSNKTIAKVLKRSTSTIGRELKRNCSYSAWWYKCERAQALSEERRKRSRKPRIREKTWKKVFELFNLDYSPEQIASVVKISHESIYRRIYALYSFDGIPINCPVKRCFARFIFASIVKSFLQKVAIHIR